MQRLLIFFIKCYRYLLSPMLRPSCRFYPSCSVYASTAIATHGALPGLFLTIHRLLRCNPFGGHGVDLVPEQKQITCNFNLGLENGKN